MPRRPFPQIQHTEADAAVVQGVQALARADVRTWQYCPCAFIKGMNDIKLGGGGHGVLLQSFRERLRPGNVCISGLESLKGNPERTWCGAVKVKPKVQ